MKTITEKQKFKDDRLKTRLKDFKDFLLTELDYTQVQDKFVNTNKFRRWIVEFRKYIIISLSDEHNILVECYEMDVLCHSFTLNLYKGSHTQYINNKNIIRTLTLF